MKFNVKKSKLYQEYHIAVATEFMRDFNVITYQCNCLLLPTNPQRHNYKDSCLMCFCIWSQGNNYLFLLNIRRYLNIKIFKKCSVSWILHPVIYGVLSLYLQLTYLHKDVPFRPNAHLILTNHIYVLLIQTWKIYIPCCSSHTYKHHLIIQSGLF